VLAEAAVWLYVRADDGYGAVVFEEQLRLAKYQDAESAELLARMAKVEHADWRIPRLTAGLALIGLCDQKTLSESRGSWFRDDQRDMPQRLLQI
jgi:hypothetical protein